MPLILLSIPGLRTRDLAAMPHLREMTRRGEQATLIPSFPAVTCPVQANMTTGKTPSQHGVVANGFYWRDKQQVEMWTAWNDCIQAPQIWDMLAQHNADLKTAVWFPLHSKGCHADLICTPAPIHNPDGSESLWCYTRPTEMYGKLRDALGHFPLQHFWGPMANIKSSAWIVDSAIIAARNERPDFFYIYLPHLDYAAQKFGPDSAEAASSLTELDNEIGKLFTSFAEAYAPVTSPGEAAAAADPQWIVASEYAIVSVDHVTYPNRVLREAGLLKVREEDGGEYLQLLSPSPLAGETPAPTLPSPLAGEGLGVRGNAPVSGNNYSKAFALVDHQLSHIFTQPGDAATIEAVRKLFTGQKGIAEVLSGDELTRYNLDHERSGQVVLISEPNSWQAYYWWLDDTRAPKFARTVDIHRKPGYDPVELFFDPATRSIPLNANLVRGSHGAPAEIENQHGMILSSHPDMLNSDLLRDRQVFDIVLRQFGC